MTTGYSSCRPARLTRFEETVQAMAEGLLIRIGSLEDALTAYRSGCSAPFRIPTAETGAAMRAWRTELDDLGHWVGSVGRAFKEAQAVDMYVGNALSGGDFEDIITQDDDDILDSSHLDDYPDPYRGVPDLPGGEGELFGDEDPDGPPKWLTDLSEGGNLALVMQNFTRTAATWLQTVPPGTTYFGGQVLVTTQSAATVGVMSRWLGRASNAATFVVGFGSQWVQDAGLPTDERLLRATTSGLGTLGGAWALGSVGATAGGACGPAAVVCSPVLGVLGGVTGAFLGDKAVDLLPWMDDPAPGEHDLDDLTDDIAGVDEDPDDATMAMVDLGAMDVALAESSSNPAFSDRVEAIVPERDEVLEAIYGDPGEPPPTGTTTTTTTTVPTTTTTVPTTQPEGPPTGTTTPTTTVPVTTTTSPGDLPDGARSPWPDGAPYDVPGDHDD